MSKTITIKQFEFVLSDSLNHLIDKTEADIKKMLKKKKKEKK